jgi:hypothetical protein
MGGQTNRQKKTVKLTDGRNWHTHRHKEKSQKKER